MKRLLFAGLVLMLFASLTSAQTGGMMGEQKDQMMQHNEMTG